MAEDTVNYRAKSIVVSKTMIFNVLAIAAAVLASGEFRELLGPNAMVYVVQATAIVNMILRVYSVRHVAFVAPGQTKAVPVQKLTA